MIGTNTTMSMSTAIEKAFKAESQCKDILLPRNRGWMNNNFTLSSMPLVPIKPALNLMDPAFKQLARTVTGMPSKAVDWFRANNLGQQMADSYNAVAQETGDSNLKFRLYTPESLQTTCYAVVTETYKEFAKSEILEAIRLVMGEWINTDRLTVGIENLAKNGRFGETIIHPWELNICVPLITFTGPRGDVYTAGVHIREKGDGTGGCVIEAFLVRHVCANGITQSKWSHQVSISHRGKNAFDKLRREIAKGISLVARNLTSFQESIEMLPTIKLENPYAALVSLAEKDLGERRVAQARNILDTYIKEMGNNADAVVNTITHIGTQDRVDSARESAQDLGGRVLAMSGAQWSRAEARGADIIANRVSLN